MANMKMCDRCGAVGVIHNFKPFRLPQWAMHKPSGIIDDDIMEGRDLCSECRNEFKSWRNTKQR